MSTPSAKAAYQDLFLRSMDAILLVDLNSGSILEANDASSKIFRLPLEKLQGTELYKFCPAEQLAEFKKMVRIASRRYHPKTTEVPMLVGETASPIIGELAMSPLKLEDGNEVLQVILRDITEKKEAERKIAEYMKRLEEMATTDGMTGLTNFRQFSKLLEEEHTRCSRYGQKYAIVFCDIDHFKKYNDQHGHPAGDALLKSYAKILQACARTTDVVARYGGEEFVILCPATDTEQAFILAERIRKSVQNAKFPNAEKQPMGFVSCSIGVASFPDNAKDSKAVLKAADDSVYYSKTNGRNKVTKAGSYSPDTIVHKEH